MRKIGCLVLIAILLMVGVSFADLNPREGTSTVDGKSSFTNLAVTGINEPIVPGYVEFVCSDSISGTFRFYLYVDLASGDLYLASAPQLGTTGVEGKPQTVPWTSTNLPGGTPIGDKVGGQ